MSRYCAMDGVSLSRSAQLDGGGAPGAAAAAAGASPNVLSLLFAVMAPELFVHRLRAQTHTDSICATAKSHSGFNRKMEPGFSPRRLHPEAVGGQCQPAGAVVPTGRGLYRGG